MAKRKHKYIRISRCICPDCNNTFPIPRTSKEREKGHIKDLYCPYCKDVKHMLEIRAIDNIRNANGELL